MISSSVFIVFILLFGLSLIITYYPYDSVISIIELSKNDIENSAI